MIPWIQLGKAPVPGGGEVRLMRRGANSRSAWASRS